ncbi:Uncharacterized protein TCAP_03873, partial [Tolypocladium capitatum]
RKPGRATRSRTAPPRACWAAGLCVYDLVGACLRCRREPLPGESLRATAATHGRHPRPVEQETHWPAQRPRCWFLVLLHVLRARAPPCPARRRASLFSRFCLCPGVRLSAWPASPPSRLVRPSRCRHHTRAHDTRHAKRPVPAMLRVRRSRPVAGLKPSDYDHEIGLVNHDEATSPTTLLSSDAGMRRASTTSALISLAETEQDDAGERGGDRGPVASGSGEPGMSGTHSGPHDDEPRPEQPPEELEHEASLPRSAPRPSIEVHAPTPDLFHKPAHPIVPRRPQERRETAVDILYENERGGFLCGVALFSSKALGSLDPPAWTNAYHKSSPTSIHTAQVPDPSWEWVWPEWRVNHQEGMDDGGWEYSFAFSKRISWHGPKWWNSFVRRRAWIRKRARKRSQVMATEPHMLGAGCFAVRPASYRSHRSNGSVASSRAPSKSSMTQFSASDVEEEQPDIDDIETLLQTLRHARIDREKREAVENYLDNAMDLPALQHEMHEIMSLFVFQASRRQLLSHLMGKHEQTVEQLGKEENKDKAELLRRKKALDAAIRHADEEVRKLAYWSDVRRMADGGELRDPTDADRGWVAARVVAVHVTDRPTAAELRQNCRMETTTLQRFFLHPVHHQHAHLMTNVPGDQVNMEDLEDSVPMHRHAWSVSGLESHLSVQSTAASVFDAVLRPQLRTEVVHTNHARNQLLRDAFRVETPATKEAVEQKLNSPFVPMARDYPSPIAARQSLAQSRKIARVQVGFDIIWRQFGSGTPDWADTFNLLKRMTPKRSEGPNMTAVRIVLPRSWDLAVGNQKIEFVDSTTGVAAKLRVSADHHNPSAIVLRGQSSVLAKAVDELIAACKDVEVFRLGEVAAFDYEVKRLWPAIEDAPDGGSSLPADKLGNVWVHKELQTYWIDKPYEQTPRPSWWTKESFESYVTALVCGRLRPHLAMSFYRQARKDGNLIDTDGIRVGLILRAFEDPSARDYVTPSVLKMAMAFMAHRGGHRASADRLFTLAEEWGLPMDTDAFNVMLDGYVAKRDVAFFHKFLQKMEARYFHPNARTWLLFLKLVQRDDERRQIIVAMYELGLFEDPATRRGIAGIMAGYDSYAAFKAGKRLDMFMADQTMRYGEDWFTVGALNRILKEFLHFHGKEHSRFADFQGLIERQSEDGRKVDISTINLIFEHCAAARDWDTALWALSRLPQFECEPDHRTYQLLISLACNARSPNALGVAFFYGVLDRKLRQPARKAMQRVLLGQHPNPFWAETRPKIFSKKMAKALEESKVGSTTTVVPGAEWAILSACDGYKPAKSLAAALDVAFRTMDRPMHQQMKDPGRETKDVQVRDFAVKLEDPAGKRPWMTVHLDARFKPETMVRNWILDNASEALENDASGCSAG